MDRQWVGPQLKFQRLTTRQHALTLNGLSNFRAHNRLVPGSNPGGPTGVSLVMFWTSAPLNQRLRASGCAILSALAEELLVHRLAERLVSDLEPRCVGRFRVGASDVPELVLAVRGSFVHDLGDLIRRRVPGHSPRIGDRAHHLVDELVVRLVSSGIEGPREEVRLHAAGLDRLHRDPEALQLEGHALTKALQPLGRLGRASSSRTVPTSPTVTGCA